MRREGALRVADQFFVPRVAVTERPGGDGRARLRLRRVLAADRPGRHRTGECFRCTGRVSSETGLPVTLVFRAGLR